MILHPYQSDLTGEIYQAWNQGARHELAVLPTGGGKSKIGSSITLNKLREGKAGVTIAHRNELVSQMSIHIAELGIPHRIIASDKSIRGIIAEHRETFGGRSYVQQDAITSVAGVDTISARRDSLSEWFPQQDYWITDEAHHLLRANKWGKAVADMPNAWGLGLTATPRRADKRGLGSHADGVFNHMSVGPSMRQLIDMGYLTDYEIVSPAPSIKMDNDDIGADGDYTLAKMREKARRSEIVGDVVKTYINYALFKRAICFATDVETSEKIAARFRAAGIPAASVSGETNSEVRRETLRRFKFGKISVLVNVDLFGEGFDVPACEVVIMARPTASLAVYLQQFGRALRVLTGKLYGLIIDHVDNVRHHQWPDVPRFWSLDAGQKGKRKERDPEEFPLTRCANLEPEPCGKLYLRFLPACPFCGHAPVPTGRGGPSEVEGDLQLLDRETLARLRAAIELESPASLVQRIAAKTGFNNPNGIMEKQAAKIHGQARLRAAFEQWAGIQRHLGRSDQESYRRINYALGVDLLTAMADRPASEYHELADKVERWISRAV